MDTAPRYRVLYDGGCGLCSRTVARLRPLDWGHRLQFVDFTRHWDALTRHEPSLEWEACAKAMHVIDPRGRITTGFDGFRTIARVIPAAWPLWPILHLPGVPVLGRRVYAFVASHRSTSCALPPDGAADRHAP